MKDIRDIRDKTHKNSNMTSLWKYVGKQLVSYLRKDDFSHAGEADAINLVIDYFNKNNNQSILDAGCGLGGTADYIQKKGWGQLTDFNIEEKAIEYA